MTTTGQYEATSTPTAAPPAGRPPREGRLDPRVSAGVLAVTAIAALLYGWGLGQGGLHPFYTAAVRSMSLNWHNFWYGAFDPTGFITTDKLPGSYWAQALLARLFGFHPWAVLLPSMLAATATVPLLFGAVRRWAGARAGLAAAVIFALTPITVALAHTNIPDTYLVLFVVAGAYAFTRALAEDRWRWLAVSAVSFGVAFQMKMLQAWLAAPVLALVYLACAHGGRATRLARTLGFGALTIAVSLAWMLFYSLTPTADRPAADGSAHGSIWEMVFVYNGVGRAPDEAGAAPGPGGDAPGPLRLFNSEVGGQISWLLPLALAGLLIGLVLTAKAARTDRLRAGFLLWGGWLLAYAVAISAASSIHPYYTTSLAPAIAALAGAALDLLAVAWSAGRRAGWLLPVVVAATSVWAVVILGRTPWYQPWLRPAVAVAAIVAVAALAVLAAFRRRDRARAGVRGRLRGRRLAGAALLAGAFALLGAPAVWALSPLTSARGVGGAANAMAGPTRPRFGGFPGGMGVGRHVGAQAGGGRTAVSAGQAPGGYGQPGGGVDQALLAFLTAHHHGEKYLVAVTGSMAAAPYVQQGLPVLPMGGFTGGNPAPSVPQLQQMVSSGEVRFVLESGPGRGGRRHTTGEGRGGGARRGMGGRASGATDQQAETARAQWVNDNCRPVDPQEYGGAAVGGFGGGTLYDCVEAP